MGGSCCRLRQVQQKNGRPPPPNFRPSSFRHNTKKSMTSYDYKKNQTIEVPTEINGKWQIPQSPRKIIVTPRQKCNFDLDITSRSESNGEESTSYSTSSDSDSD